MAKTKLDALRAELQSLRNFWTRNGSSAAEARRMDFLRSEINRIGRQQISRRNRREMMFDLNGHHGAA